jgi:S1-C subfamily serine protease
MKCQCPYVAVALITIAGWLVTETTLSAQGQQDAARKERKVAKGLNKALRQEAKSTAKDIRIAIRPGSKVFPSGTGDQPGEARYDRLRIGDLGISFENQGTGIVVEQIDPASALAAYGFQESDRILSIGERPIQDERDFVKYLFAESRKAGRIGVTVLHDDDRVEVIRVEPSVLLEDIEPGHNDPFHRLGVTLGDRAGNDLRIVEVVPHTPAETAGLRRGDVIIGFNAEKVKSAEDLADALSEVSRGSYIVRVARDESERKLEVKLR